MTLEHERLDVYRLSIGVTVHGVGKCAFLNARACTRFLTRSLRGRRHVKRVQARALKMLGIRRALLMITPVNGYQFWETARGFQKRVTPYVLHEKLAEIFLAIPCS